MQSGRTFSFEGNDEVSLSASQHQAINHHIQTRPPVPQHLYYDEPDRDLISPPPQYASPAPTEPPHRIIPRSQVPRSEASDHFSSQNNASRDVARRPVPSTYDDIPPPPPPHSRQRSLPQIDPSIAHGYRSNESPTDHDNFHTRDGLAEHNSRNNSRDGTRHHMMAVPATSYLPADRDHSPTGNYPYPQRPGSRFNERSSYSSNLPLTGEAATPGSVTPRGSDYRSSRLSNYSIPLDEYPSHHSRPVSYPNHSDSPYYHAGLAYDSTLEHASIDPRSIADDGDDGFIPEPKRKSRLPGGRHSDQDRESKKMATAAVAGAGVLGGVLTRKGKGQSASGNYGPVSTSQDGSGEGEKSGWLQRQNRGRKRTGWIVGIIITTVVILAIVAGIVGGVVGSRGSGSSSSSSNGSGPPAGSTNNAATDLQVNGDLNKDSAEIKALMNNKNLHKVFPAVDYTPWGTQYPLCEEYPPSSNNVTRDMAVLSQLTNTVRLYGNDCNQTEMVMHSISQLGLTNMKIWLGVWIDTNDTTNDRQIQQMYNILGNYTDHSMFKGVIIGNEALYRAGVDKATSEQELIDLLTQTRTKFKSLGYSLPIATSDLGDNWNGQLVTVVDYVMANIHPFFAGVQATAAAAWTWNFWQTHDVVLTQSLPSVGQIISETGWPSDGGTDCGVTGQACAPGQSGSVASVANMNTYMNSWVCQALQNGTDYFWFEAFDEPWKVIYNTPGEAWEDKWGLMDAGRNLKPGLVIPDCGGKTVS